MCNDEPTSDRFGTVELEHLISDQIKLNGHKFQLANCLHLGLPLLIQHWVNIWDCGAPIHISGFHLLANMMADQCGHTIESLMQCLLALGNWIFIIGRVAKNRYIDNDDRPDIISFDSGSSSKDLDVSMTHSWNKARKLSWKVQKIMVMLHSKEEIEEQQIGENICRMDIHLKSFHFSSRIMELPCLSLDLIERDFR